MGTEKAPRSEPWIETIWPTMGKHTPEELDAMEAESRALCARIRELESLPAEDAAVFLEAARSIQAFEDGRRASAESRATTVLTTVATLFTFMTWALANAERGKICGESGPWCGIWSIVFCMAVIYFISAAIAALQVLKVGRFHTMHVESLVDYREKGDNIRKAWLRDILLRAEMNKEVINLKVSFIMHAQKRFLLGLMVMGGLLVWDPFMRLDVWQDIGSVMFSTQMRAEPN